MEPPDQTIEEKSTIERSRAFPPPWRGWLARLGAVLWVGVCGWALYGLHREWSGFQFSDLSKALARIGPEHLLFALGLAFLSYFANATVSLIAQRWSCGKLEQPWREVVISFISSAFTMNAGGSVLGGGSIRMRFAAAHGVSMARVGKITFYSGVAGWAGHALVCGILLIFAPPPLDWLTPEFANGVGSILVAISMVLVFGRLIFSKKWPSLQLAFLTLLVSAIDWVCAGFAMYVLFPCQLPITAWSFVAVVAFAQAIAALSHVPGGIGVLEITVTKALSGAVAGPVLAGVLITYRLVYYLIPFSLAILMLGFRELRLRKDLIFRGTAMVPRGWGVVAPRMVAWLALGGGLLLLLSANSPIEEARRGWLVNFLPLPFIESSHFISSLAGALLIVLAQGLQRRIYAAWWLAVISITGGIVFSLMKGFDWEEAIILSIILICLLSCRSYFNRNAALWTYRFTVGWWFTLAALMGAAIWLGFFTSQNVSYQHELWWQFAIDGDASRFMRASVGACCVFAIVGLAQALRPARARVAAETDPVIIEDLVRRSSHSEAALAFLEDKKFIVSEGGRAGLMYADQGRSRIVMSDPLGDSEAADDLLWKFIEHAKEEGMRPVFYQVSIAEMPRLVDMGFNLYKLGEAAHVDLTSFSLEGSDARRLRQTHKRFHNSGCTFTIWNQDVVASKLDVLRNISDSWLAEHRAGEKGFSLGRFEDNYIKRFACGVVMDATGEVVAFTNLLATADKSQLSVDLMRHITPAPSGVMENLFIELMLWGHEQGYREFNLGMAPLSGVTGNAQGPLWNRIAGGIFQHAETFYNFQGLRSYKSKFDPEWIPRYIAVQSAWSLPSALFDVTKLIGGGLKNTLGKK